MPSSAVRLAARSKAGLWAAAARYTSTRVPPVSPVATGRMPGTFARRMPVMSMGQARAV